MKQIGLTIVMQFMRRPLARGRGLKLISDAAWYYVKKKYKLK